MTDKRTQDMAQQGNMQKDPQDWVTGDEPMTGAQRSYLKTLSEEAHQPFDETLSKAAASRRIDELQALTGRGASASSPAPRHDEAGDDAEPVNKNPLQSLGEAVSAPVLGEDESEAPGAGKNPGRDAD